MTACSQRRGPAVQGRPSYSVGPIDWTADEPAVLDLLRTSMPGDARRWSNAAVALEARR